MNPEKEIRAVRLSDGDLTVFVYQRWYESLIADVFSCIVLLACIGVGIWLHSQALQWIGGLMFILQLIGKLSTKNIRLYTPEQAIKWINERKAGQ
jgi:hypothetical protein